MKFNFSKVKWRKWLFYGALIILPLLQFAIMYVYVNFNSLIMAFRSYDVETNRWSWIWFENFKDIFYDIGRLPTLKAGFSNSILTWLIGLVTSLPLSIIFAYYMYKKCWGYKVFRVLLFVPSIISASILMIIFKYYADTFLPSMINRIFNTDYFGFLSDKKTQFASIVTYNIFIGFGVSVLMYTGSMNNISESVIEAGTLDGVNTFQELVFIVLPQILGTISVFVITGVSGIFVNQLNLYSIYHVHADTELYTIGYFLYRNIFLAGESYAAYPYNAALGVLVTLIVAPVIFGLKIFFKKVDPMEN